MTHVGASARGADILAKSRGFQMKGRGAMTAWPKGLISSLLQNGHTLENAIAEARKADLAVHEVQEANLITTVGKAMVGDFLLDLEDGGITYHAIGTVNTPANVSNTTLGGEVTRQVITSRSRAGNEVTLSSFWLAADATFNLKETGWFGGSVAGTVLDSGIMFSRYLQAFDNSGGVYDLTYEYVLTIEEA